MREPKVFLFDEPLSNLDAKLRVQMRAEISKLHQRLQTTFIYVTHDQTEAMTMGDRIVVMKDGISQQIDDPISLYDHPRNRFVAGFIGTPPMNFMEGTLEEDNGLYFNEGSFKVRVPARFEATMRAYAGKAVTFGIRPEDIYDPSYGTDLPGKQEMAATVEVIEPMGSEIYLYLTTGKTNFVARVEPHVRAEVDQKKKLLFNMDKVHFFDPATDLNILDAERRKAEAEAASA